MARYEFTDDKSSKFWEITTDGETVHTQWGRIGTAGQSKEKSFDSAAAATAAADKQIQSKTKKGYVLVGGGGQADESSALDDSALPRAKPASHPELEAAVREQPDDVAVYEVYGDWLQGNGEILGEAISLSCAGKDPLFAELLTKNTTQFFGPPHQDAEETALTHGEWKGYSKLSRYPEKVWNYGFSITSWRYGLIHQLFYDTGYYDDEDERGSDIAAKPLEQMLALPSARFIREIDIGELWASYDHAMGPELGYAVSAITNAPCASSLQRLEFHGGEHDRSGVSLSANGLSRSCPNLEVLSLFGGEIEIDDLTFDKMKTFAVQTGGLDKKAMQVIANHKMPVIEGLEIWFGQEDYGGNCTIEDVMPLLARDDMPQLTRLGLMNSEFGDDICRAIVDAIVLPQLESLDLSMGVITDEGAQILIDNAAKLAHLENLSVRGYFSPQVSVELSQLGKERHISPEDPNDNYRYVEAGE